MCSLGVVQSTGGMEGTDVALPENMNWSPTLNPFPPQFASPPVLSVSHFLSYLCKKSVILDPSPSLTSPVGRQWLQGGQEQGF